MKIMIQIFTILLFFVLGETVSKIVQLLFPSIFVPGTILGLLFLVIALSMKWVKKDKVEDVGNFLTGNMAFFFIPAAVGVLEYVDILQEDFFKILLLILISILISFTCIYLSVKLTLFLQNKIQGGKSNV
ncbi:MAG: CidA/LrgA family protein [Candidatus Izemoplasmatales bacterium]